MVWNDAHKHAIDGNLKGLEEHLRSNPNDINEKEDGVTIIQ